MDSFLATPDARSLSPARRRAWARANYVTRQGSIFPRLQFLRELTLAFADAGLPLLLGTDSPGIPGMFAGASIRNDLYNLVQAGLTPYQALAAGTVTAGRFVQETIPGSPLFGVIREGARADLVLLAENPLEGVEAMEDIQGVMVHGRWEDKSELRARITTMSEGFVRRDARDRKVESSLRSGFESDGQDGVSRAFERLVRDPEIVPEVTEPELNALGYGFMGAGQLPLALEVFRLNTVVYPNSSNVWDSFGEALMNDGQSEEAIRSYERSLELDPQNANATARLKTLRGGTP